MKKVLIADDDESIRWVLQKTVSGMGFSPDLAEDGDKALSLLSRNLYAAAFVDIRMPGLEGIEVLERVQARQSPTRFFIMTAVGRPDTAARSARAGASEFLTKPFDIERVEELLREVAKEAVSRERPFQAEDAEEWASARIVGRSRAILEVFQHVGKVADSEATVLLLTVFAFEADMRINGWRERAVPSPFYPDWVNYSLWVHLCFSVTTAVLWVVVIVRALRRFPTPAAPAGTTTERVPSSGSYASGW